MKKTTGFINRRIDVIAKLAKNKAYLDIISEESLDSTFDAELSTFSIDLGLDIGLKANETSLFDQPLR